MSLLSVLQFKQLLVWRSFSAHEGFTKIILDGDPRATRLRFPYLWKRQAAMSVDVETARAGYFVGFYAFEGDFAQLKYQKRHERVYRMRIGPGKVGFFAVRADDPRIQVALHLEDHGDQHELYDKYGDTVLH